MNSETYKVAKASGGCCHYAAISVDVEPSPAGSCVELSPMVFAWLRDVYGPNAWEWRDCDTFRDGARFGADYALHNRKANVSLAMLGCVLLLTELFASINAIQEGVPGFITGLFVVAIAGVSQIPGLLVAYWQCRVRSIAAIPMMLGAYLIAATGCGAFASYALGGKTDPNTAAHMHMVVLPLLHCVFAAAIYIACSVMAATIQLVVLRRARRRTSPSTGAAVG